MPHKQTINTTIIAAGGDALIGKFRKFRKALIDDHGIPIPDAWQIGYYVFVGGCPNDNAAVMRAYEDIATRSESPGLAMAVQRTRAAVAKETPTLGKLPDDQLTIAERALNCAAMAVRIKNEAGVDRDHITQRNRVGHSNQIGPPGKKTITAKDFEATDAPAPAVVSWVARNLAIVKPDKKTCPCPAAWALWEYAKENAKDFWEKIWAQTIPPRSAAPASNEGGKAADMPIRDLIAKLRGERPASSGSIEIEQVPQVASA